MSATVCAECGARYAEDGDGCASRFDQLLALDHARQEPWGSRHGLAFAAFALQHPAAHRSSLDSAWGALHRIYVSGDAPTRVFAALRASGGVVPPEWRVPPRPAQRTGTPTVTIAELADFAADTYAERLDAWCRASLQSWTGF
jgi:hypothetical protein